MFKVTKLDGTQCLFKKSRVTAVSMTPDGHTVITFEDGPQVEVKDHFDAIAAALDIDGPEKCL